MQIRDRVRELRRVKASELRPSPRNWRTHPKPQRDALQGLLAEVGYAGALLARELPDASLELIDGHLRAETTPDALVPVLVLDVTEAEAAKLLASLDPLAAMAEADAGRLDSLLREVSTGSEALSQMLAKLAEDSGIVPSDSLPEPGGGGDDFDGTPDDGPCRVKAGDLWLIDGGRHRLLCGDSTKAEDVGRLMGGDRAGTMVTDPPYAVEYVGKARDMSSRGYVHSRATLRAAISGDGLDEDDARELWRGAFEAARACALAPHAAWYVWHAPGRAMTALYNLLADMGVLHHQTLIWVKNNFVIGRCDYQWKHEPCFYGWTQGSRPDFLGEKSQTTVWELPRDTNAPEHPTQKPVTVMTPPMTNHLRPGGLAYDPFLGSGTAIIAAHRTGRRCFGLEIKPRYCEVVLRRCEAEGLSVERSP